jgi:hypothetical protein
MLETGAGERAHDQEGYPPLLETVRKTLQEHIQNGKLTLNAATTGRPEVGALLKLIEPEGALALNSAELSPPGATISLTGRGRFWTVDDAQVTASFSEQGDELHVVLSARPPEGWTLARSLPKLPDTLGLEQSLLYELALSDAELTLSTPSPDATPALNLSVKAGLQGPLKPLTGWVDGDALALSGPVDLSIATPTLELGVPLPAPGDLGPVSLTKPRLSFRTALDADVSDISELTIDGTVQIGKLLTVAVEGELILLDNTPIRFSASVAPLPTLSSVDGLLALISTDLTQGLGNLLSVQDLGVGALEIDILPAEKTVSRLALGLEKQGSAWTIGLPGQTTPFLTLEDLTLELQIDWPLEPYRRRLSGTAYATADLFGRMFEVTASLPGPVVTASMTGKPLAISQLLDAKRIFPSGFRPDGLAGLSDLALASLFVKLDAAAGGLFLDGGFDGAVALPLPGQAHDLAIESAQLSLRVALANPAESILGLRGTTRIGGASGDVETAISLEALQVYAMVSHVELSRLIEDRLGTQSTLPELDLERAYVSASGGETSLSGTLASNLAITIGHTQLSPRRLQLDVSSDAQGLLARLVGTATLGRTTLNVASTLRGSTLALAGSIPRLSLAELIGDVLGIHEGIPDLQIDNLSFDVSSDGTAQLSAQDIDLDFVSIARKLGLHIPAGTPNPKLSVFDARFEPSGSHIRLRCDDTLPFADGFSTRDFQFRIDHTQAQGLTVTLGFAVQGSVVIADGCTLDLSLTMSGVSNGEFTATGDAKLHLFGAKPMELHAHLEGDAETKSLALRYGGQALAIVDEPDVLALTVKSLELELVQSKNENSFEMDSACSLAIGPLQPMDVTMSIEREGERSSLSIKADVDPLALPALEFPSFSPQGHGPAIDIALRDIGLSFASGGSADKSSGLTLSAGATLKLSNFAPFDAFIGSQLDGELSATAKSVRIGCTIPEALQEKKWPELTLCLSKDKSIPLPVPTLETRELVLEIRKDAPAFASEWRVTMPPELNKLIGVELFADQFDLRLQIGKAVALWATGQPAWPLRDLQTETDEDRNEWMRFGTLLIEVPRLAFDGASWTVEDVGIRGLRSFGIPLAPLKFLMRQCKAPGPVVDRLPDSIPIGGIDLDAGSLDQQIPKLLGQAAAGQIDDLLKPTGKSLRDILKAIRDKTKQLPLNLQEYLSTSIPDTAQLDCGVTGSGGISIALRVDPEHPVRLILPYMGLPPGLLGLTIRELRIGEGAAGQLLMLGFDGHIDQFDLITLLDSVAQEGGQRLAHRYTLTKVFAVASTAFPIPIPLFFGELALDHVDFLGFELHTHWSFGRQEQPGLIDLIDLIVTLMPFFTEADYFLHKPGHLPESLALPFTIGTNTFRVPKYLGGGKPIGLDRSDLHYDANQSIAFLLDSLKDLNPAFAIRAIPLRTKAADGSWNWIRVNRLEAQIAFGPIEFSAGAAWCVVTEQEFKSPAIQHDAVADGKLTASMLDGAVRALPKGTVYSERGFFIFLMGRWDVKSIAGMGCQFGISYTRDQGFQTGLQLSASLGPLTLRISGTIQISDTKQHIDGHAMLTWVAGEDTTDLLGFEGTIDVLDAPEKHFSFDVMLTMGLMKIGGGMKVAANGVTLGGHLSWDSFVQNDGEASKAQVQFHSGGVTATASGRLLQLDVAVSASLPEMTATLSIQVMPNLAAQIQGAIVSLAKGSADDTIVELYDEMTKTLSLIGTYQGDVKGLIEQGIPRICNSVEATIRKEISKHINTAVKKAPWGTRGIARKVANTAARRYAQPYFDAVRKLRRSAKQGKKAVQAAARELVTLGREKVLGVTPLGSAEAKELNSLVDLIGTLDEKIRLNDSQQAEFAGKSLAQQIFARVKASTDKTIADAVPKIQRFEAVGIRMDEPVGNRFDARIQFNKGKAVAIDVYPGDIVKTANSVAAAIESI